MDSQTTPPPLPVTVLCSNCHQSVTMSDVIMLHNAPVCAGCKPIVLQRLKEGIEPIPSGLWRDGKMLVAQKDAILPDRCVKCNAPAHGFLLKRNLSWHSPFLYVLVVFPGVLIYILVAMAASKKAKLQVGLCPTHIHKRKNNLLIAWGLFGVSVLSFSAAAVFSSGWAVVVGFVLLIAAVVWGVVRCNVVSPKRIDQTHVWAKGVCPEFLSTLPRWQ
jgi:hypothetical protein